MIFMDGEEYLDFKKSKLFGWEKVKWMFTVASIITGILLGDDFPAVPCVDMGSENYELI